jgi:hypothetical protein
LVKRRYNTHKKKEKARRSSNVRTHAEMQKGLEPRDSKRVCRLGLRDNIDKHIQTKRIGSLATALCHGVAGSIPVSA